MKKQMAILLAAALAASAFGGTSMAQEVDTELSGTVNVLKIEAQDNQNWEIVANAYMELHPNVQVNIEGYDNDQPMILKTRVNAGDYPEIFTINPYSEIKTWSEYLYDISNEEFVSQMAESGIPGVTVDDKLLGICLYGDTEGIVYNKDIFEACGITELPVTLDELREVCEILSENGYIPFSNGYKETWVFDDIASVYFSAEGPSEEVANKITSGELTFADMKYFNEIFDFIDLTLEYGDVKPLETGYPEQINAMALEEVAMTHQGNWIEPEIRKIYPEANIGFITLPVGNDAEKCGRLIVGPALAYCVSKDSPNVEAALDFIDYVINSEEGRLLIGEKIGKLPLLKGDIKTVGQLNAVAMTYMESGETYEIAEYLWPTGFTTVLGETFQKYVAGEATREEVIDMLQQGWMDLVNVVGE